MGTYTAPGITAEDLIEQTSLACNSDRPFPGYPPHDGAWAPGTEIDCSINVAKSGAYADDPVCVWQLDDEGDVVVLS